MSALATVTDVEALGVNPALVTVAMLEQASARFRAEAGGHQIESASYRVVFKPVDGTVTLTHLPVLAVDSVKWIGLSGTPTSEITGWTFDGIDTITVDGLGRAWINGPTGWLPHDPVEIIYTAGYDPIPDDVRWTVAQMVARAADAGPAGVTSEQIGDYSRSFGSYTASGAMSMTREEQAVARRYRPRRTSIVVRPG